MQESNEAKPKQVSKLVPAKPSDVQIIEHGRDIHMFKMTDVEIDEFVASYMSIDFGLCALCVGAFVSFVIVLCTTQLSDKLFATFVAVDLVSFLGIVFFGLRTWKERQRTKQRINQIKESRKI